MQVGVLGIVEERAKDFVGRPLDEDHHRARLDGRFAFLNPIQPAERHYASAVFADRPRRPTRIMPVRSIVRQVDDYPCAHIMALVVASGHRGRGVGRALISAAEIWARQRGAGDLTLTTHKRRTGAHRFYRSMGYEATGYRFVKSLGQPGR